MAAPDASAPRPARPTDPRLPPGQVITEKWQVLHAGSVPTGLTRENWTLTIRGDVEAPRSLNFTDLLALPQTDQTCDIHCVTSWSKLGMHWRGVSFAAVANLARPKPTVRFVVMECEQGFTTSLPIEALTDPDVLLAHTVEGAPLPPEHGGPVRMLVPRRYFYKSAKWLRGLKFVVNDEPGFWEIRGYSNIADPWKQTRYDVDDRQVIYRMRRESLFHRITPKTGASSDPESR
jgi:DMSO/TMAO reductase YedYZ molybdopterin-dependent catalytic subunit